MTKKQIKCLLLNNKSHKGQSGQVVTVNAGYARHFLQKKKIALIVNKSSDPEKTAEIKFLSSIKQDCANISSIKELVMERRVNTNNMLYDSITITKFIAYIRSKFNVVNAGAFNFKIEDKNFYEIKTTGKFAITVKHNGNPVSEFTLNVKGQN